MYSRVEYSVWWMHRTRKFIARAQATNMMWCKIPLALALSERHQHIFVPVYESSCWNLFAGFAVQAFIRMFFQHIQFDVHICNKCSIVLLFFLWNCKDRLQMAVSTHADCVYRHRKKLTGIRTPQEKNDLVLWLTLTKYCTLSNILILVVASHLMTEIRVLSILDKCDVWIATHFCLLAGYLYIIVSDLSIFE